MALAGKMGCHSGFVYATMGDVEQVAVHSGAKESSSLVNILKTTPPALY